MVDTAHILNQDSATDSFKMNVTSNDWGCDCERLTWHVSLAGHVLSASIQQCLTEYGSVTASISSSSLTRSGSYNREESSNGLSVERFIRLFGYS